MSTTRNNVTCKRQIYRLSLNKKFRYISTFLFYFLFLYLKDLPRLKGFYMLPKLKCSYPSSYIGHHVVMLNNGCITVYNVDDTYNTNFRHSRQISAFPSHMVCFMTVSVSQATPRRREDDL